MGEWLHRTNSGRVVYVRPTNRFRYTDAARILRSMLDEKEIAKPWQVFWCVLWSVRNMQARFNDLGFKLLDLAVDAAEPLPEVVQALPDLVSVFVDLARAWQMSHFGPRRKWGFLQVTFGVPVNPWTGQITGDMVEDQIALDLDTGIRRAHALLEEYLTKED